MSRDEHPHASTHLTPDPAGAGEPGLAVDGDRAGWRSLVIDLTPLRVSRDFRLLFGRSSSRSSASMLTLRHAAVPDLSASPFVARGRPARPRRVAAAVSPPHSSAGCWRTSSIAGAWASSPTSLWRSAAAPWRSCFAAPHVWTLFVVAGWMSAVVRPAAAGDRVADAAAVSTGTRFPPPRRSGLGPRQHRHDCRPGARRRAARLGRSRRHLQRRRRLLRVVAGVPLDDPEGAARRRRRPTEREGAARGFSLREPAGRS